MAANDFQYASEFPGMDMPVKNTEGSADIPAGAVVKFDASNPVSATQGAPGVLITTTDEYPAGVAIEKIKNGKFGRIRIAGVAQVVAGAAITAGARVQCTTVGEVITCGAGKAQLGQALTAAAANDDKILVKIDIGANA